MATATSRVRISALAAATLALALVPGMTANAATTIDGPIDLGTAATFSVLASSTVTNTNLSVLNGDLGLSPETSITGFPPGIVNGTIHQTDATAAEAQADLTTAYGVAAGLTPMATGLGDLVGQSLTPGVYAGGELSLTGALELAGSAESVWVFQAASTLIVGPGSIITMSGGASACNVFWQVGSSATLDTGAQFIGTVMAAESITANSTATVSGRLLASNGAVTLDTNTITAPTGCAAPGTVSTSPTITSAPPPDGLAGTDYSHTVVASGTPSPTYTVTSGTLPTGLVLDGATGIISGEPTTAGTYTFTVTASNGTAPDSAADYTVVIAAVAGALPADAAPTLPPTGTEVTAMLLGAALLVTLGGILVFTVHRRHVRSR